MNSASPEKTAKSSLQETLALVEAYRSQIDDLNSVIVKIGGLTGFFSRIEALDSVADIFALFKDELTTLFSVKYTALYLLTSDELDFELTSVLPVDAEKESQGFYQNSVDNGIFGWALSQNKFSVLPSKDAEGLSVIIFPLKRNRRVFGAVVAKLDTDKGLINSEQQSYLTVFFKQLSMALGNAVYLDQINKQKLELERYRRKIEAELSSAKKIQQNIIPKKFPPISAASFNAYYRPYDKIGGDFYDVIKINERRFVAVMADVSGHGVPAALGTAAIKSAVYGSIHPLKYDFKIAVYDIVKNLQISFVGEQYTTLFVGDFDIASQKVVYASFGHIPVLQHNRQTNGVVEHLANNFFVNSDDIGEINFTNIRLGNHDTFLLLTDGLVEGANQNDDLFGFERVVEVLKGGSKEDFVERVLDRSKRFLGNAEIDDDIAILQINLKFP